MDIVTIDFETYYDQEYSLSKMTTEAYVRDPRFEVICVGVKVNDHTTDVYTGDHPDKFLKSLDYSNKAILCHHAQFDGAILSWHFGIKPRLWLDTLSMSRPYHKLTVGGSLAALATHYGLGVKGDDTRWAKGLPRMHFSRMQMQEYCNYCRNDVDLTYKLFKKLRRGFPSVEIELIDQLIRMFTEPTLRINTKRLQAHLDEVREQKERLLNKIGGSDQLRGMLSSNPKFAALLERLGVDPPRKTSARTGKETYAFAKTDKGLLALQEHRNPAVRALVTARLGVKSTIEETRSESLLGVAERGSLPVYLNYYGAHTGRLSGGDGLNLQNLPARAGKAIRQAITAPEGEVLVVCDLSQIEARLVAYLAGQDDLVESFRQKRDVYSEFASKVYGRTITKADKRERFVGKTCILGLGYGMGKVKLRDTLALGAGGTSVTIDEDEATEIVKIYRSAYSRIPQLWRMCGSILGLIMQGQEGIFAKVLEYDAKGIRMTNGLYIRYPDLHSTDDGTKYQYRDKPNSTEFKSIWGGAVTENVTQGQVGVLMKEQMVAIGRLGYNVRLQVHDEVIVSVPEGEAEEAVAAIRRVMSTPPAWAPDLPVACEIGYHKEYGSVVKC